jgi:hypothetical protein
VAAFRLPWRLWAHSIRPFVGLCALYSGGGNGAADFKKELPQVSSDNAGTAFMAAHQVLAILVWQKIFYTERSLR